MAKVEHFEIPADDVDRARRFYTSVFGFGYEPWGDDMGMLLQPDGHGINGDIHLRGATPHPTVVVTVEWIEDTVALVVENGGEQIGEIQRMGESSRWVYVRDSEGNIVGLWDETPTD